MSEPAMPEQNQLAQLNRMRRIATSLLVAMAVIFVCARLWQSAWPFLSYASAFAEAAMVGALADWFAVTALFRRPLGLPIPHTAIIPENKDRIGESVANFLEHNFMTHEVLSDELAQVDFAGGAAQWLSQPDNSRAVATQVVGVIPAVLHMVEDDDVGRFLHQAMTASMGKTQFAPVAAEMLSILIAGGHHQRLFDRMITLAADALESNSPYIRQKVHEGSPRWMPKAVDEKFFERLMEGVQGILEEMRQEDSPWRGHFQEALENLIDKLKTSPEYEGKVAAAIDKGLAHPLLREYLNHVWRETRQRLLADIVSVDSQAVAKLDNAIRAFGDTLLRDATVKSKLNHWSRDFAAETIVARRDLIAGLVKRVIRKWDAGTVSRKFELHVGKDLQYIRINGTLVGGLVGLALHVAAGMLQ